MKKILVYLTPERHVSLFDTIVSYDCGVDVVIPYSYVSLENIEDVIHSCVFTRHPKELRNTAVFIGGHDVKKAELMLTEVKNVLKALPSFFRISIAIDPDGAYTTACACVAKILSTTKVKGLNAVVLAGTGPVGQGISVLLAREGSNVTFTSRKKERTTETCKAIKDKYGVEVSALKVGDENSTRNAMAEADIVVATGSEGVQLLNKEIWQKSNIKILADVNAVPPYGIEGIKPEDDGATKNGKKCFGAIAIGNLKMKLHREIVKKLFEQNDLVLDLDEIYKGR